MAKYRRFLAPVGANSQRAIAHPPSKATQRDRPSTCVFQSPTAIFCDGHDRLLH
ncbi:hypothetical protein [Vacuolonema iberomarrocanum]|uniref:hypothetical protein n=1 Tax=Vacuolonema iberomarrocanum TaxID=3454632 RepID=UPI001A004889|nr:hypothetical protein [filamentous cyanobacterium LEGE 07170]